MENPIETLAARVQSLPSSVRWLYAQGPAINAAALGVALPRNRWSRIADRLIAMSSPLGLTNAVLSSVSFILLTATYVRQQFTRCERARGGALFIGMGSLREPNLIWQFSTMQASPVVRLDETDLASFFRLTHVSFMALLREMRVVWNEVREHLDPSSRSGDLNRIDIVTFFLRYGHKFAFWRAWLRHCLSQPGILPAVAVTTAAYPSFAAVAAGAETVHMEHGFQRHSLVYPDFSQSVCFNAFDAEQIRRRLPECAVTMAPEPARPIATRRLVAVAGNFWKPGEFDFIRPFIDWAVHNTLPVIVRKHPADRSDYWRQWQDVAGVEITEGSGSFIEFLERVRPRLLASWYSTALHDAIIRGIVPVTVTPAEHEAATDTVFPFRELCLCWPEDAERAQSLIDDHGLRAKFLVDCYARCSTGPNQDGLRSDIQVMQHATLP